MSLSEMILTDHRQTAKVARRLCRHPTAATRGCRVIGSPRNSVFIGTYRGYVRFSLAPTLAEEAAQETAPAD